MTPGQDLWAITAYFNPLRYQRRRWNYRLFRERLPLPLVAVELAYHDDFELQPGDADILVQLRGQDVMWQKECLLEVGLRALPSVCRQVAWVDCDLIFSESDWAEQACRLLERHALVQLFSRVHHPPRDWLPGTGEQAPLFTHRSLASGVASGLSVFDCFSRGMLARAPGAFIPGHALAARRELLERHGYYKACIVGGGDTALAGAGYGCFDAVIQFHAMNDRQKDYYLAWAKPFHESVRGAVAHLDEDIYHLWHGDMADRQGTERHVRLDPFSFDPFADIALDENGCWRWQSDKPQLHDYVRSFFALRREDG